MKEPVRTIVAQESVRAGFLGLLLLPVWGFLVVAQVLPPTVWSFLVVVPGLALLVFGLVVAVRARTGRRLLAPEGAALARWERNLTAVLLWVLVSLLAISFIGERPYFALVIAVAGGIVFGVVLVRNFDAGRHEQK
jgi:xanthine/uracil permease